MSVSTFVFDRNEALDEICFKVCACNTVRDVLEGRTISVQFNQLFLRPNKEKIDFLLEVRHFPPLWFIISLWVFQWPPSCHVWSPLHCLPTASPAQAVRPTEHACPPCLLLELASASPPSPGFP